jgi:hypothetical protein
MTFAVLPVSAPSSRVTSRVSTVCPVFAQTIAEIDRVVHAAPARSPQVFAST